MPVKHPQPKKTVSKPIANKKAPLALLLPEKLKIVCIGASAGGLEAITAFFDNVPPDSGLSFVLVQHLSPDYKSLMPELLVKYTRMKIYYAVNNMQVQPNCIYTIPSDKNMTLKNGKLRLEIRRKLTTPNLPINIFMNSMATDQPQGTIGVILSGTGSDGSLGIVSIKEHLGMVIAQDPNSAAFDSMPSSAIATGLVDFILKPSEMAATIIKYIQHPYVEQASSEDHGNTADDLNKILTLIFRKSNLDFRQYKKSTMIRRIERRMGIRNILSYELYYKYIIDNPQEVTLINNDMLIGVTSFFRDTKAFEALENEVIIPMVKNADKKKLVRVWVVACSTGQEVYSIGMLFKEQMRKLRKNIHVKIFGTDIDPRAIEKASKGIFSNEILEQVPMEYIHRYFKKTENQYQVNKDLREMAIFAKHNIIKDPPFNNIDLVSCRNLLIYFEAPLQEKVMSFMHSSLNADGHLFLGSSEVLGNHARVFSEVDKRNKIYRNRSVARIIDINKFMVKELGYQPAIKSVGKSSNSLTEYKRLPATSALANFKDAILEDLVPPTLIINEVGEIVHIAGLVDQYIKLPKRQLSLHAMKMIDRQLYVPLSNVLTRVKREKVEVSSAVISFEAETKKLIKIVGRPYMEPITNQDYTIVSFIAAAPQNAIGKANGSGTKVVNKEKDNHIIYLEEELKEVKEHLQATIEELETTNEELQATNEEMMAANEELQSSNEELQSVNEELYTVNSEFQNKLVELAELNDDLTNFIESTHIGILFLDRNLNIKRFSKSIAPIFRIGKRDINRYIGDFSTKLVSINLADISKQIIADNRPVELEVLSKDGTAYLFRGRPSHTEKNEINGVILTLLDVQKLKNVEKELERNAEELMKKNMDLEQFAYVASHDLKAPVSNLLGLTDIIEEMEGVGKEALPYFKKLKVSVNRMDTTIKNLNEVIALKSNFHLKPEKTSFLKTYNEVISGLDKQIINSDAKISTNFKACPNIYFPPIFLQSIMQNLLTNAIKYRREDVPLIINVKSEPENDKVKLSVSDNGMGIDLVKYGSKLFGLFQRFHLNTEGKGIGLHSVKAVVESYGGSLAVESKPNEGATFNLFFSNLK